MSIGTSFSGQNLESSLMASCLSNGLGPFIALDTNIPGPRSARSSSVVGSGSSDSFLSDFLQSVSLSSSDEEHAPLDYLRPRHRSPLDLGRLAFAENQMRPPRDMNFEATHLLKEIYAYKIILRESLQKTKIASKAIEMQAFDVANEIREMKRVYMQALDERERELLANVERIRLSKSTTLCVQGDGICAAMSRLNHVNDVLKYAIDNGTGLDMIQAQVHAKSELTQLKAICDNPFPYEDHLINFVPPEATTLHSVCSLGRVSSSGCAATSVLEGQHQAKRGRMLILMLVARDHLGEPRTSGHDQVSAVATGEDGSMSRADVEDHGNGTYSIICRPPAEGQSLVYVTMRGLPVAGSPFALNVTVGRNYAAINAAVLSFGEEGEGEGQLCRPWGVCCDRVGNIIVADRSNNRIQVFRSDGSFGFAFGKQGSGLGQFDRPAGVASDPQDRIVVADKDNHRVQVFSSTGDFLYVFGEKGTANGQFNYPWDVAVNAEGLIIVSDTRNHRIQLFTPDGKFINKYGFEGSSTMWKHFDSPRSVCFNPQGQMVVTDFNNHRIVIIDPNFLGARFLGGEGSGVKQFLRPQGVAVDKEGHIIVADSRNHRIQVFEQNGSFLTQFGVYGKGPGELDRPSGVCLTPDGKIVVIDFGNNRIQVF